MPDNEKSILNMALVSGADDRFCLELLEKTKFDFWHGKKNARVTAVANPNPDASGMVMAREQGLTTLTDYHDLYRLPEPIHLIVILTPDKALLTDILATRPETTRILSFEVFSLFWEAITREEGKLRERNLEVETILNGIQDFILVLTPDRKVVDVNEVFLEKMHFSRDEVVGRYCHEVFQLGNPPCLLGDEACPLNEVVHNKRPIFRVMSRVSKKRELRHFEVAFFPIWEKDGRISKFIEISRDITERKKEEEETTRKLELMVEERTRQLNETNQKMIHQNKMASLGNLSASVVHEINNPIAGILNLILLIKRIAEEEEVHQRELDQFSKYLDLMESETRRIGRIVSNLLSFSRQTKGKLKPLNLNQLVEKTLFLNMNLLKLNNISVEQHLDETLPEILGSEDQLQQVCMNILSNAAEAMEACKNGALTIESRYLSKKKSVSLTFRDTGVGIPDENLSRLFDPFFTTKKKGKGVGLGLSVVYGIIQEHGGSIHAASKEGGETVFSIELPIESVPESKDRNGGKV